MFKEKMLFCSPWLVAEITSVLLLLVVLIVAVTIKKKSSKSLFGHWLVLCWKLYWKSGTLTTPHTTPPSLFPFSSKPTTTTNSSAQAPANLVIHVIYFIFIPSKHICLWNLPLLSIDCYLFRLVIYIHKNYSLNWKKRTLVCHRYQPWGISEMFPSLLCVTFWNYKSLYITMKIISLFCLSNYEYSTNYLQDYIVFLFFFFLKKVKLWYEMGNWSVWMVMVVEIGEQFWPPKKEWSKRNELVEPVDYNFVKKRERRHGNLLCIPSRDSDQPLPSNIAAAVEHLIFCSIPMEYGPLLSVLNSL